MCKKLKICKLRRSLPKKRYFCKLKNKTRRGLTGFDSVSRRYVSVQSDDAHAL